MPDFTLEIDPGVQWSNPPTVFTKLSKTSDLIHFGFGLTRHPNPKEFGHEQHYFTVSAHPKIIVLLKEALPASGVISDILQLPNNACEIAVVIGVNVGPKYRETVVNAVVILVDAIYRAELIAANQELQGKSINILNEYP